jgi:two-component system, OmpR family, response regulator
MPGAPLILVVEDDYDVRMLIARFLEDEGYRIVAANEKSVGVAILQATNPALAITDVRLRGGSGLDIADMARARDIPVLLISGDLEIIEKRTAGSVPFLQKPFRMQSLVEKVEELIGRRA